MRVGVPPESDLDSRAAGGNPHSGEFIGLIDVIRFLRRYSKLLALCVAIAMLVAWYVVATSQSLYTASAEVLIDPRVSQIQREQIGEVYVPIDTAQMESQLTLLRSEGVARKCIEQLDLLKDPEFAPSPPGLVRRLMRKVRLAAAPMPATPDESMRSALNRFQVGLDVIRVGISYGIRIQFSSEDPIKATKIANTVAAIYVQDQIEVRSRATQSGSLWLEEKIAALRRKMNAAALNVQAFKARHDYRLKPTSANLTPDKDGKLIQRRSHDDQSAVTYEELDATAQTYRKLYESNLAAYSLIVLRDSYPVSDARIISRAITPWSRSHPRTQLILIFGLLVGLLGGVGIALVHNAVSPRAD